MTKTDPPDASREVPRLNPQDSHGCFEMEVLIMRRTIRKTFLLEGETVTMKYIKQLCGEERYDRMIEDAKKKFFADPTADLCYPTPAGYLTIWFQLA